MENSQIEEPTMYDYNDEREEPEPEVFDYYREMFIGMTRALGEQLTAHTSDCASWTGGHCNCPMRKVA